MAGVCMVKGCCIAGVCMVKVRRPQQGVYMPTRDVHGQGVLRCWGVLVVFVVFVVFVGKQ